MAAKPRGFCGRLIVTLDAPSRAMLDAARRAGRSPLHEMTADEMRTMNRQRTPLFGAGPEIDEVSDVSLTSSDGGSFPVRVFAPREPRGIIVYFHGGGWMTGELDGFDTLSREIAHCTGSTVVLVEYRKAPEAPFPAAYEDAWAALTFAAESVVGDRDIPLVISGDSSGGNLAAAVAQRAAAEGSPALALQVLVYPVLDADFDTDTYRDPDNALFLTKDAMEAYWDAYLPDRAARTDPRAAPLRGNVRGTPPAVMIHAEHDVLRSEGMAYARKLRSVGVAVEEHVAAGQMHGFFTLPNLLPGQADALALYVDAVRRLA